MLRWNTAKSEPSENLSIDLFIADLIEVFKKHKMAISHEDCHGAFEIRKLNDDCIKWLSEANDALDT